MFYTTHESQGKCWNYAPEWPLFYTQKQKISYATFKQFNVRKVLVLKYRNMQMLTMKRKQTRAAYINHEKTKAVTREEYK